MDYRYNAVYSFERQFTFWRGMLPPSSGLKSKPGEKPAAADSKHVMSQKKEVFITTAVTSSDPAS
jgi:hypothetical protein